MCSVLSNDYLALNLLQLCSVFTDKVLNLWVRDQGLEKVNLYDFHSQIFPSLKVTSAIKHRNTAEEIIIYTHTVYSLLLKLERNKA